MAALHYTESGQTKLSEGFLGTQMTEIVSPSLIKTASRCEPYN